MWGIVNRTIQRIESVIDFDLEEKKLYDQKYCSKEDENCSV